jgi:hypothetical protein
MVELLSQGIVIQILANQYQLVAGVALPLVIV